jgi:hypothetical protein
MFATPRPYVRPRRLTGTGLLAPATTDTLPVTGDTPCATCATEITRPTSFVYASGRIEARFPTLAVEKEFAQASGRANGAYKTDQQLFHDVVTRRGNRYLARQLCWVLSVQGLETYLLQPADPADLELLLDAIRPAPSPSDIDVVVGTAGPIAPPDMCNGLMVPIVTFEQIYSFDRASLVAAVPRPEKTKAAEFSAAVEDVIDRLMQLADNAGGTDEHRAINYVAFRYPAIYALAADAFARNHSLTGVAVRPSTLSGTRSILDVIFTYTHRATDVAERSFARVDVTEAFPFLVSKLAPYVER